LTRLFFFTPLQKDFRESRTGDEFAEKRMNRETSAGEGECYQSCNMKRHSTHLSKGDLKQIPLVTGVRHVTKKAAL